MFLYTNNSLLHVFCLMENLLQSASEYIPIEAQTKHIYHLFACDVFINFNRRIVFHSSKSLLLLCFKVWFCQKYVVIYLLMYLGSRSKKIIMLLYYVVEECVHNNT